MTRYKLTDKALRTNGNCQWVVGEWKGTNGEGDLCGYGWLHCYDDPLLAVLMNPIHARYEDPRLWECEVAGKEKRDGQLNAGWTCMRLVREIPLPHVTTEQRVRFGALCARAACADADTWAKVRHTTAALMLAAALAHVAARDATAARAAEARAVAEARAAARDAAHAVARAAALESADAMEPGALDLLALARQAIAEEGR